MKTESGQWSVVSCHWIKNKSRQVATAHWQLPILLLALLTGGCAATSQLGSYAGPTTAAAIQSRDWSYEGHPGKVVETAHYRIFTTVHDAEVRQSVAQVMEGALTEYQKIAPNVPLTHEPMLCYLFGTRGQWMDFTRQNTGAASRTYLQINRGGYTIHDWYVAYFVGQAATYSVAAHEGWHQFVARHFKGRIPPFLEEGIATMFEDMRWKNDLPQWNLAINRSRAQALRAAVQGNYIFPLAELVNMHAGNVVNLSGNKIEAFYAEDWAFATFLWRAENGRYRPAMRRMLADIADGSVYDPTGIHKNANLPWNPAGVKPMLEHYLGMNLDQINARYQKYIRQVAFDDYAAQWN